VKLTRDQFIHNMNELDTLNAGQSDPNAVTRVYVWLRHISGTNGPVTAIADQFIA